MLRRPKKGSEADRKLRESLMTDIKGILRETLDENVPGDERACRYGLYCGNEFIDCYDTLALAQDRGEWLWDKGEKDIHVIDNETGERYNFDTVNESRKNYGKPAARKNDATYSVVIENKVASREFRTINEARLEAERLYRRGATGEIMVVNNKTRDVVDEFVNA